MNDLDLGFFDQTVCVEAGGFKWLLDNDYDNPEPGQVVRLRRGVEDSSSHRECYDSVPVVDSRRGLLVDGPVVERLEVA